MKNIPLWQNIKKKKYPKLNENIETDILIVGGGITGISAFYWLKDDKRKVTLVEKNKIGFGTTSRSSAKITFLQENIYSKLQDKFDIEIAHNYYDSQKFAINELAKTCQKEKLDCDLEKVESYLYTTKEEEKEKIKREQEILESFGEKTNSIKFLPNKMNVTEGFSVKNTYVFHPLKFVNELAEVSITNMHKIYEDTCIIDVREKNNKYYCYTKDYLIVCNTLIMASGYPSFLVPFLFPIKCHLEKSYLLATPCVNTQKFSAINISNPILSIRYYKNYCLNIGGSHNLCFKNNEEQNFKDFALFSKVKNIEYAWSNHDIMTLDHLPYIGFLKDNLILATGYNTWGMTNGFLAGIIIKDLVNQKENKYQKLFDPKRNKGIKDYPVNIFSNSYSFITSKINTNKNWYDKNPLFTKINGEDVAIYKDSDNKEYIVYSKCPHLKCNLLFNKEEKTWDCPCHGSRFTLEGKSIIGPSNYDIKYKKEDV